MKFFAMVSLLAILVSGCNQSTAQKIDGAASQLHMASQTTTEKTQTTAQGQEENMELKTATFAGGCFWCTEAVFLAVDGVDSVLPGYMGGHTDNPTYKDICTGTTGHAEVIQIKYDAEKVSFEDLLFIFFKTHDPTTLNRQGNDVGTQYRSGVFYHDEEQKESAEAIKKKIDESGYYGDAIVTEVTEAATMYVAEDYHVNYFNNNPGNGYCRAVIPAKLAKLKKLFGDKLKSQ